MEMHAIILSTFKYVRSFPIRSVFFLQEIAKRIQEEEEQRVRQRRSVQESFSEGKTTHIIIYPFYCVLIIHTKCSFYLVIPVCCRGFLHLFVLLSLSSAFLIFMVLRSGIPLNGCGTFSAIYLSFMISRTKRVECTFFEKFHLDSTKSSLKEWSVHPKSMANLPKKFYLFNLLGIISFCANISED